MSVYSTSHNGRLPGLQAESLPCRLGVHGGTFELRSFWVSQTAKTMVNTW